MTNPEPFFRELWLTSLAEHGADLSADNRAELLRDLDARIADMRAVRRALAALPHTCEVCGVEFVGRADARYCGAACRQRAHRARVTVSAGA